MAGRHLIDPAGRDDATADDSGIPNGGEDGERLVDPGAVISDGTSVTVDMEAMPHKPDVTPSPPRPDALIEHGLVGDGTEME